MMIPQQINQQQQEKTTFITNYFDKCDEILQLCMSDIIWQKFGFDQPIGTSIDIRKKMIDKNNGVFIIDEEIVARFHQDFSNSKWTLYANERY